MKKEELHFISYDGKTSIRAVKYIPEGKLKGILQIAHGMVEFIDRYENFAQYLCERGYLVCGNDHLGHGESVLSQKEWGYFGEDGNNYLLGDMYQLNSLIKKEYPGKPYYLLGHSMGSFYGRQYICEHGDELDGAIIMGTGFEPKIKVQAGMLVCRLIALFKGWHHRSNMVNNMAFGAYNKKFEPARTKVDWLSKNEEIVDWYLNEPRCNFVFTLNGYYNMFKGIVRLHDQNLLKQMPKELPVLFVSGKDDPVGSFGKEVEAAAESLKAVGAKEISLKLYENDRHEILNETDRERVYEDLYNWLETRKI